MHAKIPNVRGLMAVIAGAVISLAVPARAANFALSPIKVTLVRGEHSQLLVMTNQDNVPLRFQLNAYRWDERPDGQMVLTPTDDVIFFPQLFDFPPHGTQNIRVGVVATAQASVSSVTLSNSTLSFTVRNSGNAHLRIKSLRVEGFGAGTQPIFSKTAQGWYVLAGGSRNYELALSRTDCSRANRLNLLVETDRGNLQIDLPIGAASCATN